MARSPCGHPLSGLCGAGSWAAAIARCSTPGNRDAAGIDPTSVAVLFMRRGKIIGESEGVGLFIHAAELFPTKAAMEGAADFRPMVA